MVHKLDYLRHIEHEKSVKYFFENKNSTSLYNLFYQDGLKHAFQYLFHNSKSGKTFNPYHLENSIRAYEEMRRKLLKVKNYPDFVYIEGYLWGLHSILHDINEEEESIGYPFYYIMGFGAVESEEEFKELISEKAIYHKEAEKVAKKYFIHFLTEESDLVPHHAPFVG